MRHAGLSGVKDAVNHLNYDAIYHFPRQVNASNLETSSVRFIFLQ